jgi:putative nucleotidyltransferase with HDIG domain
MSDVHVSCEAAPCAALIEVAASRMNELERKLERFAVASLEVLVTSFEARDSYMAGHSLRVAQFSATLAHRMGHTETEVEQVRLAARLHDIGMMMINDRTINAEGPLNTMERDQVRQHPMVGYQMLQPYAHLRDVGLFIRGHHERWDGTGYPDGLASDKIPWGARTIAAAETYDALVTSRAYRKEIFTPAQACARMTRMAGEAFDPEVIEAVADMIGQRGALEFLPDHEGSGLSRAVPEALSFPRA